MDITQRSEKETSSTGGQLTEEAADFVELLPVTSKCASNKGTNCFLIPITRTQSSSDLNLLLLQYYRFLLINAENVTLVLSFQNLRFSPCRLLLFHDYKQYKDLKTRRVQGSSVDVALHVFAPRC